MEFWTPENIKKVLGAAWIARPECAPPMTEGLSTDSRMVKPGQVFVALKGERTDGHAYLEQVAEAGASLLIVSNLTKLTPQVSAKAAVLSVSDTGAALLKLGQAYRRTLDTTRVIAVGGSNGKTTTVRLIAGVLGGKLRGTASVKSFNNAIGVPLTILSARPRDQFLVCEVGTNAPGEIGALAPVVEPDIAVITSIGREHLEGLGSIKGVVQEEVTLLSSLRAGGLALVSADSPELVDAARAIVARMKGRTMLTFGASDGADVRVTDVAQSFEGVRFSLNGRDAYAIDMLGAHNACNAAAAVGVARRLGLVHEEIASALAAVKGPEMRLERTVRRGPAGSVRFINDAYNANPESAIAAISTFAQVGGDAELTAQRRRVIVLGDMLELGEQGPALHREVCEAIVRHAAADRVILVGALVRSGRELLEAGLGIDKVSYVESAPGLDAAAWAGKAAGLLKDGDLVLLKGSRGMALERVIAAWETAGAGVAASGGGESAAGHAGVNIKTSNLRSRSAPGQGRAGS